jgi:hypothetical protein
MLFKIDSLSTKVCICYAYINEFCKPIYYYWHRTSGYAVLLDLSFGAKLRFLPLPTLEE